MAQTPKEDMEISPNLLDPDKPQNLRYHQWTEIAPILDTEASVSAQKDLLELYEYYKEKYEARHKEKTNKDSASKPAHVMPGYTEESGKSNSQPSLVADCVEDLPDRSPEDFLLEIEAIPFLVQLPQFQGLFSGSLKTINEAIQYVSEEYIKPGWLQYYDSEECKVRSDFTASIQKVQNYLKLSKESDQIKKRCYATILFFRHTCRRLPPIGKPFIWLEQKEREQYDKIEICHKGDDSLFAFHYHFQKSLIRDDTNEDERVFKCKLILFASPSGTGKSWLLLHLGQSIPTFTFTLRAIEDEKGSIPCPDEPVIRFLVNASKVRQGHIVIACLLAALLDCKLYKIAQDLQKKEKIEISEIDKHDIHQRLPRLDADEDEKANKALLSRYRNKTLKCKTFLNQAKEAEIFQYQRDVVDVIYELRPRQRTDNVQREFFIEEVIELAWLYVRSKDTVESDSNHLAYLYGNNSITRSIVDYFKYAVDNTNRGALGFLKDGDHTLEAEHQMIVGWDEARWADQLIVSKKNVKRHVQGYNSFIELSRDLERMALRNKDFYNLKRVFFIMCDATSTLNDLTGPSSKLLNFKHDGQIVPERASFYNHFGSNLFLRYPLANQPDYYNDWNLRKFYSSDWWKLVGRVVLGRKSDEQVVDFVLEKLLGDNKFSQVPMNQGSYARQSGDELLHPVTFAVVSWIFYTDHSLYLNDALTSYHLTCEDNSTNMRQFIGRPDSKDVELATPNEPLFAILSAWMLNYGKSIRDKGANLDGTKSPDRKIADIVEIEGSKSNDGWKILLTELVKPIELAQSEIDIGQSFGRLVISRAVHCCLPSKWNIKKKHQLSAIPLPEFLQALLGRSTQEQVSALSAKIGNNLSCAYVNLQQWVPYSQPLCPKTTKEQFAEPLLADQMHEGFLKGCGFICMPNTKTIDLVIPIFILEESIIKMIKKAKVEVMVELASKSGSALYGMAKMPDTWKLRASEDGDSIEIGGRSIPVPIDMDDINPVLLRFGKEQYLTVQVECINKAAICVVDEEKLPSMLGSDKSVNLSPLLHSVLDLGINTEFAKNYEDENISSEGFHKIKTVRMTESTKEVDYRLQVFQRAGWVVPQDQGVKMSSEFVNVVVRGMSNEAYPCMVGIDDDNIFRDKVNTLLQGRNTHQKEYQSHSFQERKLANYEFEIRRKRARGLDGDDEIEIDERGESSNAGRRA